MTKSTILHQFKDAECPFGVSPGGASAERWLSVDRIVNVVGSLLILVVGMPVMLVVATLIRCRMGSPVLFRHTRAGYRGKPFTIFKFRTMREAFGSDGNPLSDGQRLTGLGRFLRRASLDELPQLLNVLRGEMRLVGPRPLLIDYVNRYTPRQARRLEVKPGVTGWAQINGRNTISWEKKFELDVWYVNRASFQLDAWILLLTIWDVVRPKGISHTGHATMPEFLGTRDENGTASSVREPVEERHVIPIDWSMSSASQTPKKLAG